MESSQKRTMFQFYVGYMTQPILREHKTHKEQVIKIIYSESCPNTIKCIKNLLMRKIGTVIPLKMLYEHRYIVLFSVLGSVFYAIIYN